MPCRYRLTQLCWGTTKTVVDRSIAAAGGRELHAARCRQNLTCSCLARPHLAGMHTCKQSRFLSTTGKINNVRMVPPCTAGKSLTCRQNWPCMMPWPGDRQGPWHTARTRPISGSCCRSKWQLFWLLEH